MGENTNKGDFYIPKFLNSTAKIIIGTAIMYFIFAQLSLLVTVPEINIPPFFPAIGLAIAFVLIFGRIALIGVAIGSFAFSIELHLSGYDHGTIIGQFSNPLLVCLIRPLIASLNALIVSYLILFWCKNKYPFNKKSDVLYFTLSALIGSIITLLLGLLPLTLTSSITFDKIILTWSNWSQSNLLGIILFTPLVLSWFYKTEKKFKWTLSKKIESILLIIVTLSITLSVFLTRENNESVIFFLLIWASLRFEMKMITSVILIVTVISVKCTLQHLGGFGWNHNFLMLQLFLFVNITSVLFLKAILKEKEQEESKLKISERDLGLEKNILRATIESPKEVTIFSLDSNLNYLSFNSAHADYMKKTQGADIKIGDNHAELFLNIDKKEEIAATLLHVLKGNMYSVETKNELGEYLNIAKSPIKNDEGKIIGITTVITNITELKLKELELEKNNFTLNERIKELRCLFDISKIISNKTLSKSEKMEACVQTIPKALQFPERANCRIQFQEKMFISANFQESDYFLKQPITVNGKEWGSIEVNYFDTKKTGQENLFFDEEVKLLETLADIISKAVETKIAVEKVQKSEEKFRSIYENSLDIYFKKDLEGTIIEIGPSVEKHLHQKQESIIGRNIRDFYYDPADVDRFYNIILKEQQINDYQEQFITATGDSVYLSVNAKLIYDSDGKPIYVEGTRRNISERILNEKHLQEATEKVKKSEERFRSIYKNLVDIYFKKTIEGIILDISPSVENHFHLTRESVIGKNCFDFYYDRADVENFIKTILRDQQINDFEQRMFTANGEILYFSVNAKLYYDNDGNPEFVEGTLRNVNERINNQKQLLEATEKIKKSEEEFRAIFESFEDIYFRSTLDGYFQNVSPSIEKILKYKREDIIGTYSQNLYLYQEDRTMAVEIIKKKGHINDFETILKDKDNKPVHLSVNAHLVNNSKGDPIYIEGTIRDISERKNNELKIEVANQAIKESEKKYRTFFESVRDVFFRASVKDHKIVDISPSCSYFGMEPKDLIGTPIPDFYLNPEDRLPVLTELMQKGEINDYVIQLLLNSKPYYVSINSKIAYDQNGEPEFIIGSFRDVTERIQAEENLKISEEKFRTIYENFEDIYFKTTLNGKIIDISPSFEKHFRMPRLIAINRSVLDFYSNLQDRFLLLEKLNKHGQVSDFDVLYKDAYGNALFLSINAHYVYDTNGIPTSIEGSMRNINERRFLEEEMLTKNRQLEFENTELEQFAYIASHDLQEPLITVIQFIQLLQEELGENLDEDQKQYLQFINNSTSRMQLLVKGLLDYSRIGKERKNRIIDCNEIITNVIKDMDVSLKESNAVIEYENLPVIEGNATEMRQLFQNIISNANKFRKKDQQPRIKIAAVKEESNWLFSIEDNGIGIKEKDMDKIFVIFKRLHNRDEYQGTGIGLSHCKKIVEHHNGKIWVESVPNEGSTFKWTFPLEQN